MKSARQRCAFMTLLLDTSPAMDRRTFLQALADSDNVDGLVDVVADLGGQEALAAIRTAIVDVRAWWP